MVSLLVRFEAVCMICRKCEVSLMKDLPFGAMSLRKKSTSWEILSVGELFPEMIGLPGGGSFPLWILGSR